MGLIIVVIVVVVVVGPGSVRSGAMNSMVPAAGFPSTSISPLLSLVFAVAFAAACSFLAVRKGRRAVLWAVLGFFFGLVPLVVLIAWPSAPGAETAA